MRTSRLPRSLEDIVDAAAPPHGSEASCKLFTKGHEVERLVDRLSLGLDAQSAPGRVKLSLIHHHILANPPSSAAPNATNRGRQRDLRLTCNGFRHVILRLYKT